MYNPQRRNRNIGTAKQGYSQDNKLCIVSPCQIAKSFTERLEGYTKHELLINGHQFLFVVENTRDTSKHACSIADIAKVIEQIPPGDYGDLELIILRQPKRKEEILSPVWGRLVYAYDFENLSSPAIILEATNYTKHFKWPTKLSLESQRELDRLKADGHNIIRSGNFFIADYTVSNVRSTQLYRTLLHEFGHYVHYLERVERSNSDLNEEWEVRFDNYFKIPQSEKEAFANRYASTIKQRLEAEGIIPFAPL